MADERKLRIAVREPLIRGRLAQERSCRHLVQAATLRLDYLGFRAVCGVLQKSAAVCDPAEEGSA